MIVKKDKMFYIIYINNTQFTCLFEDVKNIQNIPKILEIPELKFIKQEKNKIYYQSDGIEKVKLNLDGNFIEDKFLPLLMPLNRIRDILSQKISINFHFCFENYILQKQEEKSCCLKNIIKDSIIYLSGQEFNFIDEEGANKNRNNIISSDKKDVKNDEQKEEKNINEINNINNKIYEKKENENKQNEDKNKNEEKAEEKKVQNKLENKVRNKLQNENKAEVEYIINSNNIAYDKIKMNPEENLTALRENLINIIPKRSVFLEKGKEIPTSKEDKILIKNIADKNIISFNFPKENEEGTIVVEFFINGRSHCTKECFLKAKLKTLKVHLDLDETYKFIFKDKLLSIDEENKMTLDELCYKESNAFLIKIKEEDINRGTINLKNFNNIISLEKKKYKNSFTNKDTFDNWIIFGKEKSGKTSFINCILNYLNRIKFEDNFRYFIEGQKINGYENYDIQGDSQKIRIAEFPGFSGDPKKDKLIIKDIKEYLRKIKYLKLICFVISGNETRLNAELKNIFHNIFDIFPSEIQSNFIFLLTNCDANEAPIKNTIKEYKFLRFLFEQKDKSIFEFNNSYLDEVNQKELWNFGIVYYRKLMDNISKKNNISLEDTKFFINFDFDNTSKNFINSLKQLIAYKNLINILSKIKYCKNEIVNEILIDIPHYDSKKGQISIKKIPAQYLKNNQGYLNICLNDIKIFKKNAIINLGDLYENLRNFYDMKLFNFSLEQDLKEKIDDENKNSLIQEINSIRECYNKYLKRNTKISFKDYYLNNFNE